MSDAAVDTAFKETQTQQTKTDQFCSPNQINANQQICVEDGGQDAAAMTNSDKNTQTAAESENKADAQYEQCLCLEKRGEYEKAYLMCVQAAVGKSTAAIDHVKQLVASGAAAKTSVYAMLQMCKCARENGNPQAFCETADLILSGECGEQEVQKATACLLAAVAETSALGKQTAKITLMQQLQLLKSNANKQIVQLYLAECYKNGLGTQKDTQKALKQYIALVKAGNNEAVAQLASMCKCNASKDVDMENIMKAYRSCAEAGNTDAQYELANCLLNKNDNEAVKWYKAAAQQGSTKALAKLAKCYALGLCQPHSEYEAFQLFMQVEDQNIADVMCALGRAYQFGWTVYRDVSKAVQYYIKAADAGSYEAMWRLADCKNKNVDKQLEAAFEYFEQRAKNHDFQALFNAGCCRYYGIGIEENYRLAGIAFQKAASNGCSNAMAKLSVLYKQGLGVRQDASQAFSLAHQAAAAENMQGQFCLAQFYASGTGIRQNSKQAVFWYEKAAVQGNAQAAFNLAVCFQTGNGVEVAQAKAFQYYNQAAMAGSMYGQYNVGLCYKNGHSVEQSYEKAVYWFQKAVDQGEPNAMIALGFCYDHGCSVAQDIEKAFQLYKNAAETGNVYGQFNLANCYANSIGTSVNYELALKWYESAAEKGCTAAFQFIGDIYYHGRCGCANFSKAAAAYEQANLTSPQMLMNLADCYERGIVSGKGAKEAAELREKAKMLREQKQPDGLTS